MCLQSQEEHQGKSLRGGDDYPETSRRHKLFNRKLGEGGVFSVGGTLCMKLEKPLEAVWYGWTTGVWGIEENRKWGRETDL